MKHSSSATFAGVRQQFAQPRAALAVLREFEDRRRGRELRLVGRHAGEALAHANGIGQFRAARAIAGSGL